LLDSRVNSLQLAEETFAQDARILSQIHYRMHDHAIGLDDVEDAIRKFRSTSRR
jgi:hypothetical protein